MVRSRFVPAVFSPAITLQSSSPGPVAQLAEQQTLNLRVVGSIPTRLTSLINTAPGGFTLHPALGAISLCHISRGGEHPP